MKLKTLLTIGALAITSSLLRAQTTNPAPYCAVLPSNDFLTDEITNVTIGTLNNSSTGLFTNSRYVYYNSVTVPTLAINSVVNMSVSVRRHNCMPDILGAYIDINGDNTFTPAEYLGSVPNMTLFTSPCAGLFPIVTFTFNLTIPNTALPGVTRMRVVYSSAGGTPNPCTGLFGGEVEDYNVNLVTGGAATPPVANFTVPVSVCKNQPITLNDNSTNTPTAWSWSLTGASPATSTLQNPAVTYTNTGTYTISLVSSNASGASAVVSKTIAIDECTGIETNSLQTENLVSVYPNPSKGYYVVNLTNATEVTIFNILGEKVITKLLPSGKSTIDLSNQPNGVYSVIIGNTAKRQNVKLIKE